MATHLARIFGTEEDKINCPFYFKIGACRHGDRCSRKHVRPNWSETLLIPHMFATPPPLPDGSLAPDDPQRFVDFFYDIVDEVSKFGHIEEVQCVENVGEHMLGNVYMRFASNDDAAAVLKALNGRFYHGQALRPEFSPVTDFSESRCRQFEERGCNRGGLCNFMHLRRLTREQRQYIKWANKKNNPRSRDRERGRSRSRSRRSRRGRSRSRSRSRSSSRRSRSRRRSPSASPTRHARSASEERRARIAAWNAEKS